MKHRTSLLISVGATVAVLATACGSSTGSSPSSSKTLTVAYWTNFDTPGTHAIPNLIKSAAAQFAKAHSGVTIKTDPITTDSESQYYAKLDLAEKSASTSPDVSMEDSFLIGADASAGYLQPIPQITSWDGWSKFPKAMQDIVSYNGKPYGVVNSSDVQVLFYDANIFKKAGISVPWQPHSFNDIVTAAAAIKQKVPGVTPAWLYAGLPLGEASSFRGFEVFLDGTSDRIYDDAAKKWEVSGPGFTATWQFLADMKNYVEPESAWSDPNASETANLTDMPKQTLGMIVDGSWISTAFLPGGPKPWADFFTTYRVAQLPTSTGQAPGYTNQSGGFAWSVPKHSKNSTLAEQFVEQLSSAPNLAAFDAADGNLPPRTDVLQQPAWKKVGNADPVLDFATNQLQYTNYRPNLPAYTQISNVIATLTGEVASGKVSAAQAAAEYKTKVTAIVGAANVEQMTQ